MNYLGPDEAADFTSRLRRQGGTQNAQAQPFQFPAAPAPTGSFKPQGITPPGPNSSPQWFNPPQEFSKGGDRSSVWTGANAHAYGGVNPYASGDGWSEGGPQGPFTPQGQMGPKGGPMGPGGYGRPQMGMQPDPAPRGGEGGNQWLEQGPVGPFTPQGQMEPKYPMGMGGNMPDPRFPMHQRLPKQSRQQWQQNRLGQEPQLPQENPIFPTNDWNGGQGNNRGW